MVRFLADIWFDSSIDENEEEVLRIGSIKCGVENFESFCRGLFQAREFTFLFLFFSALF